MYSQHITKPEVQQLHESGVHFVLCRSKDEGTRKAKAAIAPRWQHHPAGLEDVLQHRASGWRSSPGSRAVSMPSRTNLRPIARSVA